MTAVRDTTLYNLQICRAFAAFMVVFYHGHRPLREAFGFEQLQFGAAGVDIFFVLSGLIMVYTNRLRARGPWHFLVNRARRIIPLYWLALTGMTGLFFAGFQPAGITSVTAADIVQSYLFVPYANANGKLQPVLNVGWTLNFEMMFYLIFALSMLFRSHMRSLVLLAVVFATFAIANTVMAEAPAAIAFYGALIAFEFVFGCILGILLIRGAFDAVHSPVFGWVLLLGGCGALLATELLVYRDPAFEFGNWRLLFYGLPATAIISGAVLLERQGVIWRSPFLLLQGNASYAVYLTHMFVLQPVFAIGGMLLPSGSASGAIALTIAGLIAAGVLGTLTYIFFERPVDLWLRGKIGWHALLRSPIAALVRAYAYIRPTGQDGARSNE